MVNIGVKVHGSKMSRALHKTGLYRRVARKKPFLKKNSHKSEYGVCYKAEERPLQIPNIPK